jgi:hypothetical protein
MLLTRIEPDSPEKEVRTFECPMCAHLETIIAEIA